MDSSIQSATDLAATQLSAPSSALSSALRSGGDVDKAAQDFESMFMTQMLQPMFEGVGVDPTFGGGHGEEIMRTFLLQEYGKIMAKSGHLGISAAIKNEMIRAQASASKTRQGKGNPYASAQ